VTRALEPLELTAPAAHSKRLIRKWATADLCALGNLPTTIDIKVL
jgi:hypothetical protein